MAILRSDRDRRILGDRIIAKQAKLSAIHIAVAEALEAFVNAHRLLDRLVAERLQQEAEEAHAVKERRRAVEKGARLYSWAYSGLDTLARLEWDSSSSASQLPRAQLFPLGRPSLLRNTPQRVLDALAHLESGLRVIPDLNVPEGFVAKVESAHRTLAEAMTGALLANDRTRRSVEEVTRAREQWDRLHLALREITTGVLRMHDRAADARSFFHRLGRKARAKAVETTASEAVAVSEAGVPPIDDHL